MKARQAKVILRNLSVLHLRPGDVVILRTPDRVPELRAAQMRAEMEALVPGHRVLVVQGVDVSVVRPASPSGFVDENGGGYLGPNGWPIPVSVGEALKGARRPTLDSPSGED